eukprot:m.127889 g.127889  ORF g.127889 m.127889 type:complete len:70 (+) comp15809_c0_seq5:446-655(+)
MLSLAELQIARNGAILTACPNTLFKTDWQPFLCPTHLRAQQYAIMWGWLQAEEKEQEAPQHTRDSSGVS